MVMRPATQGSDVAARALPGRVAARGIIGSLPLAFVLTLGGWLLRGFLDGRVALGWAGCAALGPGPGCRISGGWLPGGAAREPGESRGVSGRGRGGRGRGGVPGQPLTGGEGPGEDQLGVAGGDDRGPPAGLFGVARRWGDPAEGGLWELDGVL